MMSPFSSSPELLSPHSELTARTMSQQQPRGKMPTFQAKAAHSSRRIQTKSRPPPLYNHSTLETPDSLVLFGGQRADEGALGYSSAAGMLSDAIWVYDLQSESFERIWSDGQSSEPPMRMDAALAWIPPGTQISHSSLCCSSQDAPYSKMILHGGYGVMRHSHSHSSLSLNHHHHDSPQLADDTSSSQVDLDDLWIFDFDTRIWTHLETDQRIPMSGHRIFISNGKLYAVKGYYDTDEMLQHHKCLNTAASGNATPPRDTLSVYILNLTTLTWRTMKWNSPSPSQSFPHLRESFLGCLSTDAQRGSRIQGDALQYGWLMFGGDSEAHGTLNDLWLLKREDGIVQWEDHLTFGDVPSPRTGSQMVWICGRWVILWGGDVSEDDDEEDINVSDSSFYLLDMNTCEWSKMQVGGTLPQKGRVGHSMSLLYHEVQQQWKLIIFGGKVSQEEASNDIFEITLQHQFEEASAWWSKGEVLRADSPSVDEHDDLPTPVDELSDDELGDDTSEDKQHLNEELPAEVLDGSQSETCSQGSGEENSESTHVSTPPTTGSSLCTIL